MKPTTPILDSFEGSRAKSINKCQLHFGKDDMNLLETSVLFHSEGSFLDCLFFILGLNFTTKINANYAKLMTTTHKVDQTNFIVAIIVFRVIANKAATCGKMPLLTY